MKTQQSKANHTWSLLKENLRNTQKFCKQIKKAFPVDGQKSCKTQVFLYKQQTDIREPTHHKWFLYIFYKYKFTVTKLYKPIPKQNLEIL